MSGMFNVEAEQALLGALMENNERADVASGILKPEHFYEPTHGAIYEAIIAMRGAGSRSDATTLRTQLENHDGLKELGGAPYLVKLQGASIGASAFMDYAHLIESEWRRRTLKRELEAAMASVEGSADAEDGRTAVEKVLAAIPEPVSKARTVSSLKAVTDAIVEMNAVYRGEAVGVPTGFDVTDKRLGGFFKQNLIILAGRPSMGKTALALGMAGRAAQGGKVVAIVSREMSNTELMHRFIAAEANIEYRRFRRSDLSEDEFRKAVAAAKKIEGYPFEIVPDHVAEVPAIRAALRAIRQKHGRLDLVVVDYLQLLTMPGYERSTTNDRVSAISAGLKGIAKELDVPVVALSQLSRGVETREDKHPLLSDLRDSGSIEQDADVVLFCYRHAYYLERQQPPTKDAARADYEAELKACRNMMEIITAKQRQGSIGVDMIGCHMGTNRFWNLHNDEESF